MTKKQPKNSEVFSFRTSDKETIKQLKLKSEKSDFLSELLEKYYSGKLIAIDEALKKIDMAEMKFRRLKAKTIQDEIRTKIALIHDLKQSPEDTLKIINNKNTVFNIRPSTEIIQADKSLRCMTCGKIIEMRAYDFEQVNDYEKHVRNNHERELFESERKQMLIVLGEVS